MESTVFTYTIDASELKIDPKEVLRYIGYGKQSITREDEAMVERLLPEVLPVLHPRACYGRYAITLADENEISLPYGRIVSKDLTRNLSGCEEIFMFAATIGPAFDTLIKKTRVKSVADACVLQAIGAAAVEDFVERLCEKFRGLVEAEGKHAKPRYSPGFGDVPLENQRGVFQVLNPAKHAGITLMDTLIMAPEKSVTAYVGIEKNS